MTLCWSKTDSNRWSPLEKGRALRCADRDLFPGCPANCETNGGTTSSNPSCSSGESANFRLLASIIRARNPAGGAPLARRSTRAAVDILEGLIRQGIDRDTAEETADNPVAPRRPKAAYSAVLCAYIAHHKTTAVQEMLFACPRKAKEVAVVLRLKQFRPHEAMKALAKEAEPQSAYAVLEGQFRPVRRRAWLLRRGERPASWLGLFPE